MLLRPDKIQDRDLYEFMVLLRRCNLRDVVILGGAVRDTLVGRQCRDIDIAVRIPLAAPNHVKQFCPDKECYANPWLVRVLFPLAKALGCNMGDFSKPIPFGRLTIDLLGTAPVEDLCGNVFPDIFVDVNETIFGATPELTVNRIALSADGNLWPRSYLTDFNNRLARFTGAPCGIRLRQTLRALKTCRVMGLHLSSKAAQQIQAHIGLLKESESAFFEEIGDYDTSLLVCELLQRNSQSQILGDIRCQTLYHLELRLKEYADREPELFTQAKGRRK